MSSTSHTLLALKAASKSKSINERQASERHRDCLVLILSFLRKSGYIQTAAQLQSEAGSIVSRYQNADNIDLVRIIAEYEDFCEMKFQKKPKFSRPISATSTGATHGIISKSSVRIPSTTTNIRSRGTSSSKLMNKTLLPSRNKKSSPPRSCSFDELQVNGRRDENKPKAIHDAHLEVDKIIKPLPSFGNNFELRTLAESIQSEILDKSPEVHWDDVVALDDAKRLLKEAVVLPLQYPDLFSGLLTPWRGILLYGPPGTGKTLLAKAVATECKTTFFNIAASSIVSKFRGDSEKLIKVLFELARYHAPSTIFIDEIDSIMGQRGHDGELNEHEGSRRMKTELLIAMDGLNHGSQHVFVLAASNMPWDLDKALLRRLEKRIHVPMPDKETRYKLLKSYLSLHSCCLEDGDMNDFALKTEGYNCADIRLVCKEAAMQSVRSIFNRLEGLQNNTESHNTSLLTTESKRASISNLRNLVMKHPIRAQDLYESLEKTKPSMNLSLCAKYCEWSKLHGSV